MIIRVFCFVAWAGGVMAGSLAAADDLRVEKVEARPAVHSAAAHVGGRVHVEKRADGSPTYRFQWPGVYFSTEFAGARVYFEIGAGDAIYHVSVDGRRAAPLVKPAPGVYAVEGLDAAEHSVRIDVVSENAGGPVTFGGFSVPAGTAARAPAPSPRRIEFIGDSHTVGYGNTSPKRECTSEQVWLTTDNSQAFGPLTAQHYHADYRVNAISGRGIVRSYNGAKVDALPQVYPFVLFDKQLESSGSEWQPQIVVINLGTNDFSTPLNPGEKWASRDELRADYERTYVEFVRRLRRAYPQAFFLLLGNDMAEGEIAREVRQVAEALTASGEKRVAFLALPTMELTACDWHPSLADHRMLAQTLITFIDARPEIWGK